MRIAVFGTGGVGGYFGGRLAQSGLDVTFVARGEHLQAIRKSGLRVDSIKGDFIISPAQATDQPAEVGPVDAVLIGVKSWQVPEAAEAIRPMMSSHTMVIPLQNGVEAPGQLAEALGPEVVLGGLCRISVLIAGPGHIRHVGIDPFIAFGELDGSRSERVEKLRQAFEQAQVNVDVPADIRISMWEKFTFIAAISGVGAVTRAPAGVMRSLPATRALLEEAMREIYAVGRAQGVHLPADVVDRTMKLIDGMAPGVTASMQRDIMEGRPSELESQNGAIVRMGAEVGVLTPVHAYLYASLLPQENRARGQVTF